MTLKELLNGTLIQTYCGEDDIETVKIGHYWNCSEVDTLPTEQAKKWYGDCTVFSITADDDCVVINVQPPKRKYGVRFEVEVDDVITEEVLEEIIFEKLDKADTNISGTVKVNGFEVEYWAK